MIISIIRLRNLSIIDLYQINKKKGGVKDKIYDFSYLKEE